MEIFVQASTVYNMESIKPAIDLSTSEISYTGAWEQKLVSLARHWSQEPGANTPIIFSARAFLRMAIEEGGCSGTPQS